MATSKKIAPDKKAAASSPKKSPSKKHAGPPSTKKSAAKKHAGKPEPKHAAKRESKHGHGPKHEKGKHLRRAFEHLGRVEALQGLVAGPAAPSIALLLGEAQRQINHGDSRSAADLLRAAEHLSFAAAFSTGAPATVPPELEQAIDREFEKKVEKTQKHARAEPSALGRIIRESLEAAHTAREQRSFREALELVRAAEALIEVDADDMEALPAAGDKSADKSLPA